MWNLSSLAQRAKDAAAQIEHQINDSIGVIQEEEENTTAPPPAPAAASNSDHQEETTADDYLNVEEECVSFSERDEETQDDKTDIQPTAMRQRVESAPSTGEISFVDLTNAFPQSHDEDSAAADVITEEARGKIALLEQMVKSLEEQLMSAKEESEKYYASNLELMEQVRELKEENQLLRKEKSLGKEEE